jgi:hypothetical protein
VLDCTPPVQPGQVVTVEWGPLRNPYQDGNYLYALTAYPAGPSPHGQFLGYGRIVIRRGGRGQGRGYPSSQPHQEITGNLWLLGAQIEKERLQSGRFPPGAGKPGYISIFKTASVPW